MREPTLSLCMIVRDEEACLDACLSSVAPLVDEMVIVDTGSTDQTPAIARKYGAKLIFHPWNDDFSEPRNVGLGHATGDWILALDADEALDPAGLDEIRKAIRDPRYAAYQLPVVNLYDDDQHVISLITRMFRNDPGIRFQNVIHEQVTESLTQFARARSLEFGTLRAQVIHTGYHPSVVDARAKNERNDRLFRKQIEQFPDDLYSRYKYADFLRKQQNPEPAKEGFALAYKMLYRRKGPRADFIFAGEIVAFHAMYHFHEGRIDEADRICRDGVADLPSATPNLLHIAGKIAASAGDHGRAEELFRRVLSMAGKAFAIPGQPGITSYLTMTELAGLYHVTGRSADAWEWFDAAVQEAGGRSVAPVLGLAQCLCNDGRPAEALQCLAAYMKQWKESPTLILATGKVLLEIGNPAAAEKWFTRAVESATTATEGRALLARSRLFQGELRLAEDDWHSLPEGEEKSQALRLISIIRGETPDRPVDFGAPNDRSVIGGFIRGLLAQGHEELVRSFHANQSRLDTTTPGLDEILTPVARSSAPTPHANVATAETRNDDAESAENRIDVAESTETRIGIAESRPADLPSQPAPDSGSSANALTIDEEAAHRRVARIDRPFARLFDEGARVLDVECGSGGFLETLEGEGRVAFGIDSDPEAIEHCLARGIAAEQREPTDLDDLPGNFDGVHATRVLETLTGREARAFLRGCAARLRPGGILVLRTQNWENEQVRNGSFWLEPTNVRPYPLPLLADMVEQIGMKIELRGHESDGWNDTYIVARRAGDASTATHATPKRASAPRVVWEGEFFTSSSYARVNREIAGQWLRGGNCELSLLPVDDGAHDDRDPSIAAMNERVHAPLSRDAEFHIRHRWPAAFYPPSEGRWIQIQPYEFGRVPQSWIRPILASVDEIWVPSHYARRCYTTSGIPEDRVAVVPNGVDGEIYRPDVEPIDLTTKKRFRFLFVGGSIWRKGIDVLLDVYGRTFTRSDDVCLVIKDTCQQTFYKDRNAAERIRAFMADPNAPELLYLEDDLAESEMPALYAACDVLVHPYRGEGFGLPVIEAMACAKPVLLTRGGACDEFTPQGTVIEVAAERVPIRPAGLVLAGDGWVLEPDPASLQAAMRAAVDRSWELPSMGALAREHVVRNFSWGRAADLAMRRLEALRTTPPRRLHTAAAVDPAPGPLERVVQQLLVSNPDGAMEILVSEAAYRPDDPLLRNWMGVAFQAAGDIDRAKSSFEDALRMDRNYPEAWYHLGLIEANTGDAERARTSLETAKMLGMDDAALHNDLGVLYTNAGEMDLAERCIRRALDLVPHHPDAIFNLGQVWMRRGSSDRAKYLAEEVLASDPGNSGARALLEQVASSGS